MTEYDYQPLPCKWCHQEVDTTKGIHECRVIDLLKRIDDLEAECLHLRKERDNLEEECDKWHSAW